ncbi:hypothetical protein N1851_024924 [Merluccius polli]|uniref:Uncharacterized protein n=1 Tax=Merluccius polli TaxID=89951 RepID=A0AA47MEC7_MERPO|nr:hypothetical protein N1851_024924 [Merluccius polli]
MNDTGAKELFAMLDTFELSQHVKGATHCKGQTLDLIITKGLSAISVLPPPSPSSTDDLVDNFNSKIVNDIDVVAPSKVKIISGKQKAPWRNVASVTAQKRRAGKHERIWRKTKLHVHHDSYKESLRAYNLEIKSARETFFSNIINSITNNAQTLFDG